MMRRTILTSMSVLAATAITLAAAAPAGASTRAARVASPSAAGAQASSQYQYSVVGGACNWSNEQLQIRQFEYGLSGTDYFTQTVQGQVLFNGSWHVDTGRSSWASGQFPDDSRSFWATGPRWTYGYGNMTSFHHRIAVTMDWWNNNGTPGYHGDDFIVAGGTRYFTC